MTEPTARTADQDARPPLLKRNLLLVAGYLVAMTIIAGAYAA